MLRTDSVSGDSGGDGWMALTTSATTARRDDSARARVAATQPVELDEPDDRRLDEGAHPAGAAELLLESRGRHDQGSHVGDGTHARHATRTREETDLTDDAAGADDPEGLDATTDCTVHLARALRHDVGVAALVAL